MMNRLWVRFSLTLIVIILLITVSPIAYRWLARTVDFIPFEPRRAFAPPPAFEGIDPARTEQFRAKIEEQATSEILRGIVIAGAVGLLVGVWLSRGLARPLTRLAEGAEAIARQDLSVRVPVDGTREIQSVAESFNHMAAELESAETLRRNLLADVAHELRHPVHLIQGNLQAILDGVYDLDMAEVARLSDQAGLLTRLVEDLHELALAEAHQLALVKQDVDLGALVAATVESSRPSADEKGVVLTIFLPDTKVILPLDPARIRQTLQNLINNAIRHTPADGRVTVTLSVSETAVTIEVRDSGQGIAPEQLPHLFDRFYRGDPSRSRESGGTGLGLAIARAIVEAHAGSVTAVSPGKGQGATFTIQLPAPLP